MPLLVAVDDGVRMWDVPAYVCAFFGISGGS